MRWSCSIAMNFDRREFVALTGAGLATLAMPASMRGCGSEAALLDRVGVQLYTLRSLLKDDFDGTLARVAAIGYREVEFAGYYDRSAAEIRWVLDANGLTAPAAHIPIEVVRDSWKATLDDAQTAGHSYLVVAWLAEADRGSIADLQRTAELFSSAALEARKRGVTFAYHNHDFEFATVEGRMPYDVLLEECDPAVQFEMDLYWITKGGQDPVDYFQRWPGRFPLVHVKDMTSDGKMVAVGEGDIDWPRIFAARRQAGIRHYFVEHDEPGDPMESVRVSYQYLKGLRA